MTDQEIRAYEKAKQTVKDFEKLQSEENSGIIPVGYRGPLPRPKCDCDSWGCYGCLNTANEIRKSQGVYS